MTLDEEMAWTPWSSACRDPYPPFRLCRRPRAHSGEHASGFGASQLTWPADPVSSDKSNP